MLDPVEFDSFTHLSSQWKELMHRVVQRRRGDVPADSAAPQNPSLPQRI